MSRPPKTHSLKTWPRPFNLVVAGSKNFEIRKDDRGFMRFDFLRLREWDPDRDEYSGCEQLVQVLDVFRPGSNFPLPIPKDSVAMPIRLIRDLGKDLGYSGDRLPCGCHLMIHGRAGFEIVFCGLHQAAASMQRALERCLPYVADHVASTPAHAFDGEGGGIGDAIALEAAETALKLSRQKGLVEPRSIVTTVQALQQWLRHRPDCEVSLAADAAGVPADDPGNDACTCGLAEEWKRRFFPLGQLAACVQALRDGAAIQGRDLRALPPHWREAVLDLVARLELDIVGSWE